MDNARLCTSPREARMLRTTNRELQYASCPVCCSPWEIFCYIYGKCELCSRRRAVDEEPDDNEQAFWEAMEQEQEDEVNTMNEHRRLPKDGDPITRIQEDMKSRMDRERASLARSSSGVSSGCIAAIQAATYEVIVVLD